MPGPTPHGRTSTFSTQSSATTTGRNNYGTTSTSHTQTSAPKQAWFSASGSSSSGSVGSDLFAHGAPANTPAASSSFATQSWATTTGNSAYGGMASSFSQTPAPPPAPVSAPQRPTATAEQEAFSAPSFDRRPRRRQQPMPMSTPPHPSASFDVAGQRLGDATALGAGTAHHTLGCTFAPTAGTPVSAAPRHMMGSAFLGTSEAVPANAGVTAGGSYVKPVLQGILRATPMMASMYRATHQPRHVQFMSEGIDGPCFAATPPPPWPPQSGNAAPASAEKAGPMKRFARAVWQNIIWLLALAAVIAYAIYRRQPPANVPAEPKARGVPLDFRGGRPLH